MPKKGVILGIYWDYIGIMENKMETVYIGFRLYWGCVGIRSGKENGSCYLGWRARGFG